MSDFRRVELGNRHARLRTLRLTCLAFNGMQATITAYFVVYLTTSATRRGRGFVFSVAVAVAVPGRHRLGLDSAAVLFPARNHGGLLWVWPRVALLAAHQRRLADAPRRPDRLLRSAPRRCPGKAYSWPKPRARRRKACAAASPAACSPSARSARSSCADVFRTVELTAATPPAS